jgi:hypothetical protein
MLRSLVKYNDVVKADDNGVGNMIFACFIEPEDSVVITSVKSDGPCRDFGMGRRPMRTYAEGVDQNVTILVRTYFMDAP